MTKKDKKAAFTGPFADINFGDYAMLVNNIYDLGVRGVGLFSYEGKFLKKIREDYLSQFDADIIDVELDASIKEIARQDYVVTPPEMLSFVRNYDILAEKMQNFDILIVSGGGYFNSLWSMPHRIERLVCIIVPVLIAQRMGKQIVFTGNSFGPYKEDAQLFAGLFNLLNNVIYNCRDKLYSPMWLRQLGIEQEKIGYLPDDLLSINSEIIERKAAGKHGFEDYIVLETYLPLPFIEEHTEAFVSFAEMMHKTYHTGIVFLPFNLNHGGVEQGNYLQSKSSNIQMVDITEKGYLQMEDAISIVSSARLVICSRYHALVLAMFSRTPVVSVLRSVLGDKRYYYNKNYGLLKELFSGMYFDESQYLRFDYLEALSFVSKNYEKIIFKQQENFGARFAENFKYLEEKRNAFFKEMRLRREAFV